MKFILFKAEGRMYVGNVFISNIQISLLESCKKPSTYLTSLLSMVFGRETLIKGSVTGRASNRFKNKDASIQLDPVKIKLVCGKSNLT